MAQPRRFVAFSLLLLLVIPASVLFAKKKDQRKLTSAAIDPHQQALHVLNRFTFGPRPGEVDRVSTIGVEKWFDEQLHPERIDNASAEAHVVGFRTLNMSIGEMVKNFPPPQLVKAVMNGRASMPSDPEKRAIYEAQMERLEKKQDGEKKAGQKNTQLNAAPQNADQQTAEAANPGAQENEMSDEQKAARREARFYAGVKYEELMSLPADKRMQSVLKMSPEERSSFARGLKPEEREQLYNSVSPEQRETLIALANPQGVVVAELQQAKVLRAIYSERQLQEVMTDFWFNHFNVFVNKGQDRYFTTSYERDVIRAHSLGKFKDLLEATAKSPAMLWYLDNWDSVGPNSDFAKYGPRANPDRPFARRAAMRGRFGIPPIFDAPRPAAQKQKQGKKNQTGLNENYARELMELHTLGVDGGYTQKDVTEVARVFTGWTLKEPLRGGGYDFNQRRHDPGDKNVLGHKIHNGGEKEGMQVLDLLAHHPATAKFICTKLATRFVSDNPPPALIDRMSQTFLKKDGDIREVLLTMFHAPEFWSQETYRAKVKTPLEFLVSAVRASGADVTDALPLVQTLNRMGMPLYQQQPPTGYPMKAEAWVNSAALLNRMNFSLGLSTGRMRGIQVDQTALTNTAPQSPDEVLSAQERKLLAGDVSTQTHETILKQLTDPQITGQSSGAAARPPNSAVMAGLIMGSPEFQRR